MKHDLISVIIPAYNHEKYIQKTLNSIIAQTYTNLELILIDDGSKDKSFELALEMEKKCKKRFKRVIMKRQQNQGVCTTLNNLLQLCKGKYVFLIASDDIALPHAIEKEHAFLSQNDDYSLAVGNNNFINDEDKIIYYNSENNNNCSSDKQFKTFADFLENEAGFPLTSSRFTLYEEFYKTNFVPNGYLLRKSTLDFIGPFTKEAPLEDYWLMLQLSKYSKLKYINEILFSYRLHETNTAKQRDKINSYALKTHQYEQKLLKKIDIRKVIPSAKEFILSIRNKNLRLKYKIYYKIWKHLDKRLRKKGIIQ